jgi:3-methylcrotonyl-CoA carboxylase alpha subunit
MEVTAERDGPDLRITFPDRQIVATVVRNGTELTVFLGGRTWRLALDDPMAAAEHRASVAGTLTAPIPGVISAVFATVGANVRRGEALLVLEAMKMEHQIRSPADGLVEAIHVSAGDQVEEGAELAHVQPSEEASS